MTLKQLQEVGDTAGLIHDFTVRTLAPASLLFLRGVLLDLIDLGHHLVAPDEVPDLQQAVLLAHQLNTILDWTKLPSDQQEYPAPRYNRQGAALNSYNAHGLSDLPIWPILQVTHPDPEMAIRYRCFVARMADLLLRYSKQFSCPDRYEKWCKSPDNDHPLGQHLSAARNASAAIRYLPLESSNERLNELLDLVDQLGVAHAILMILRSEPSGSSLHRRLSALNCLIGYLGGDTPPKRGPRKSVSRAKKPIREGDNCLRFLLFQKPDDETDPAEAGIEPLPISIMLVEPEDDDLPDSEASTTKAQQRKRRTAHYQSAHIARASQPLPYSMDYLQPHQLEYIHNWLRQSDTDLPLKRMIAGMILLGQSIDEMNKARFSRSVDLQKATIEVLADAECWRIRPQMPEVEEVETDYVQPIERSLLLPIASEWKALLLPDKMATSALLNAGASITTAQLRQKLRDIGHALRPSLLSQWLGRQLFLCHKTHNPAAVLTPFGAPHLVTLTHYEHPRVCDLIDRYVAALRIGGFSISEPEIVATAEYAAHEPLARTGAPNASKPEDLCLWVALMLEKLEHMPLVTADDRCAYSNCFTRYSFLMMSANTLLRGVTNPDIRIIDRKRHLVIISDKDRGKNGTMDRLVELTRTGLSQIDFMQEHRHALMAIPGIPPNITNIAWPILSLTELAVKDVRKISIKPARTAELVGLTPVFPGPLNAFRKFMHTRLGELGLPGQHLDVISGHWQPGQEGYSQYSALVPRLLMQSVAPLLQQIQDELGFRPHRSRLT